MSLDPSPCRDIGRWNALARHAFGDIEVRPQADGFSAAMRSRDIAAMRLVDVQSTAARVHGGAGARVGWYLLFNRGGACKLRQQGRAALIDDGEMSLLRADAPYEIEFGQPNRMCVLGLPLLDAPPGVDDRVVRRHGRDEALVLGTLLGRLQGLAADSAERLHPATLRRAVFDLLMLTTPQDDQLPTPAAWPGNPRQRLTARLMDLVARQFEDPELDAACLGRQLGVSGRHVQSLFAAQGTTLGTVLLEQRLQQAAHRLREPGQRSQSVSALALQAGFSDLSHFCRAFRRRFGCTASAWRRTA